MLDLLVWSACAVLEGLLLVRAARTNLFRTFPLFFSYIACVLARDLLGTTVYVHYPSLYGSFYWTTELLVAVISYGVLLEIYIHALKNYPGVATLFRALLLVMFLAIAIKVGVSSFGYAHLSAMHFIADLERNLRRLQAVLLAGLLGLFAYYKIPVGRNLRGLVLGYALFVGADVITLTFMAHPAVGLAHLVRKIEPLCYTMSLIIWSLALWVPRVEGITDVPCGIEQDYEHLAREARMMLLRARTHLARGVRL
ncbi:MAG TPA: hypothetical protein VGS05_17855 [Candidatus Sulfotelmatobacter sp.]|nr:hypothetical protein [Candidatus Sulfotelmatobacter sp.]